jgi:hypothetical protein
MPLAHDVLPSGKRDIGIMAASCVYFYRNQKQFSVAVQ